VPPFFTARFKGVTAGFEKQNVVVEFAIQHDAA
jgi:hypothetical protein